ncbi:hypothetical protein [Pinisolibacter sp.]
MSPKDGRGVGREGVAEEGPYRFVRAPDLIPAGIEKDRFIPDANFSCL